MSVESRGESQPIPEQKDLQPTFHDDDRDTAKYQRVIDVLREAGVLEPFAVSILFKPEDRNLI